MNSPAPVPQVAPVGAMPWYKSPVYVGIIVMLVTMIAGAAPRVAAFFGWTSPTAIQTDVETGLTIIGLAAGAVAEWKRRKSLVQPIVASVAAAAVHPATLANLQVSARMAQAGIPSVAKVQATIQATKDATK